MRFEGSFAQLKERLEILAQVGTWKELNPNQYEFRTHSGGVMSWYPGTGELGFQGQPESSLELEQLVKGMLSQDGEAMPDARPIMENLAHAPEYMNMSFLDDSYADSELVLGFVGALGTDLKVVCQIVEDRLKAFRYTAHCIRISTDVIAKIGDVPQTENRVERIDRYMREGNRLREVSGDNSILALGAAVAISQLRYQESKAEPGRNAYLLNSLKTPFEVQRLRKIYAGGFFLIGVHADHERRSRYLLDDLRLTKEQAADLISRDENEKEPHGQHTRDTYHLSDFFVSYDGNLDALKNQIWRILDLLFGKPYVTPTFDEYAMFMAFSASLRSADLSRQVGAVLTKHDCIIATGANDVPKAGGGLYWPTRNAAHEIVDEEDGRDYKRGEDSNAMQKKEIVENIIRSLPEHCRDEVAPLIRDSGIKDITEYGRVVHAEMEALLSSSRVGVSAVDSTLYCTTYPCHNCAKHIIAAGVDRVVYVEPYPKSKAQKFHSDSISQDRSRKGVFFDAFIGVGPRSFFDLFSMSLGSGYAVIRKTEHGQTVDWTEADAKLRTQMLPCSYIDHEDEAGYTLSMYLKGDSDERK